MLRETVGRLLHLRVSEQLSKTRNYYNHTEYENYQRKESQMAWIRTFEENEARGLLSWVYRVARWTRGRVPNIVKVSGLNPRLLVTLGPLFRTLMEGPSPLTRAQRKMVAIVASKVNNCFY